MQRLSLIRILAVISLASGVIAVCVPLFMRGSMERYTYLSVADVPQSGTALVLGASVVRGQPSPMLEERANIALQLYRAGKVQKILVSGDGSSAAHDEVSPVRRYLESSGVQPEDIFLDHAGFNTYASMYRARDIFLVDSVIVVTQDFHLPRALFLGRTLGLSVVGVPPLGSGRPWNYVREVPASLKAIADVVLRQKPRYLGEPHPITGDGTVTWY